VESKDPGEMGAVHESSHFGHPIELVVLVHQELLRHFHPDVAAERTQVPLRIVQEDAGHVPGRHADGASEHLEIERVGVVALRNSMTFALERLSARAPFSAESSSAESEETLATSAPKSTGRVKKP